MEENKIEIVDDTKKKYNKVIEVMMKVRDILIKIGDGTQKALKQMEEVDKRLGCDNKNNLQNFKPDLKKIEEVLGGGYTNENKKENKEKDTNSFGI